MPSLATEVLFLTFYLAAAAVDQPRCYWPDGSFDPSGYVCNKTAVDTGGASACCLHNDACYQSGSCFQDWSGVMYRQSCTDQSWRDPSCPSMCLNKDSLGIGVWIQTCDIAAGKACCVKGKPCCNDTSMWFDFKPGYISAVINGDGSNRLGPYIAANPKSSSSSSSVTATSELPSRAAISSPSSPPTSNTTALSSSSPPSNSSTNRNVAIAVGVIFGALSLLLLTGMIILCRKYKGKGKGGIIAKRKSPVELSATNMGRKELAAYAVRNELPGSTL